MTIVFVFSTFDCVMTTDAEVFADKLENDILPVYRVMVTGFPGDPILAGPSGPVGPAFPCTPAEPFAPAEP